MIDYLAKIYGYAQLIPEVKEVIEKCRKGEEGVVQIDWRNMTELLVEFCKSTAAIDAELGSKLWEGLQSASNRTQGENGDYRSFADGLEQLIPVMYDAVSLMGTIDQIKGNYRLVSTASGFLNIQNVNTGRYVYGMIDPMHECRLLALARYEDTQQECHILGAGLGYLAYQLYCVSQCRFDVYVYELDQRIVDYAFDYGVLSWIPEERLHIVVDGDSLSLIDRYMSKLSYGSNSKYCYYVSRELQDRLSPELAIIVADFETNIGTSYAYKSLKAASFYRNIINVPKLMGDYRISKNTKEWIVIAGGPSVDDNISYITEHCDDCMLICPSTVYGKLLDQEIHPDIMAVLDPTNNTFGHMEGITDHSAVMIIAASANWQFGEYYTGDKYMYPSGGTQYIDEYLKNKGYAPSEAGSTVSTLCIEIAIRYGAKRINLVGLDLAYPGDRTHASGTMECVSADDISGVYVDSVNGDLVKTTSEMDYYRREIERVIRDNPGVEFINYSMGGALINGAKWKWTN